MARRMSTLGSTESQLVVAMYRNLFKLMYWFNVSVALLPDFSQLCCLVANWFPLVMVGKTASFGGSCAPAAI